MMSLSLCREKYARRGLKQIGDIIERCRFVFLNQREIGQLTSLSPIDGCRALVEKGRDRSVHWAIKAH